VLTKVFELEVTTEASDIEAMEAAAAKKHLADLEAAVAKHASAGPAQQAPAQPQAPTSKKPTSQRPKEASAPAIRANDPCPCGSGKRFRECHGEVLDDDAA
jgi:preprotein translocase subunit SecA